jgi:hypothetical protein
VDDRLVARLAATRTIDITTTARVVTDPAFRRRFFTHPGAEVAWYLTQAPLDELVDDAPMIEALLPP